MKRNRNCPATHLALERNCSFEWTAEIETRIETLRAQKNGEGQPLTKVSAIALTGRGYTWFVKQHEGDPGPEKRCRDLGQHLIWDMLYPHAPGSYLEDPKADPSWEWAKEPEVREAVRLQIAEGARVARSFREQIIRPASDFLRPPRECRATREEAQSACHRGAAS